MAMNREHVPSRNEGETSKPSKVTVATAVADSQEIDFESFATLGIYVPSGSSITSLTLYGAIMPGGTYARLKDEEGANLAAVTVAAGYAFLANPKIAPWGAIKLVGDAAGYVLISRKS